MPRIKSLNAMSLENLCLNNVSRNIDKWWQKYHQSCKYYDTLDRLAVVSPFNCLSRLHTKYTFYFSPYFLQYISYWLLAASELLEKINQQLGETETKYLELLIVPQLRSLTVQLADYVKDNNAIIGLLHLASIRCQVK